MELASGREIPAQSALGAVRHRGGSTGLCGDSAGAVAVPPAGRTQAGQPHRGDQPEARSGARGRRVVDGEATRSERRVAQGDGPRDLGRQAHGGAQVPDTRRRRRGRRGHPAGHRERYGGPGGPWMDLYRQHRRHPAGRPPPGHRRPGNRHRVGAPGRHGRRDAGQRPLDQGHLLEQDRRGHAVPALPRLRGPGRARAPRRPRRWSRRSSPTTPATARTSSTACSGGSSAASRCSASATWPGTRSASVASGRRHRARSMPPSTGSITPVTKDEAGLSRKAAAAANSSGSP